MSKASQRKRSAYQNGYRVGRYGWPKGVKCFRVTLQANSYWRSGLRDGRDARQKSGPDNAADYHLPPLFTMLAGFALAVCAAFSAKGYL